jgi:hypothetical protein
MKKHQNDAGQDEEVNFADSSGFCPLIDTRSQRRHFDVGHVENKASESVVESSSDHV